MANRAAYFSDALGTFCTLRAQNPAAAHQEKILDPEFYPSQP